MLEGSCADYLDSCSDKTEVFILRIVSNNGLYVSTFQSPIVRESIYRRMHGHPSYILAVRLAEIYRAIV